MTAYYVVKTYGWDSRAVHVETDDIARYVRAWLRAEGIRPKSYEAKTYPGLRPVYHEWTCPRGIVIEAHEIYA